MGAQFRRQGMEICKENEGQQNEKKNEDKESL
jgi:hypothetical protein